MTPSLSIDAVRNAVAAMPEDSLSKSRSAALERLHRQGLPTTRHEDWKYTDLGRVIDISNNWLTAGAGVEPVSQSAAAEHIQRFDADWLIVRNGDIDLQSLKKWQDHGIDVRLLSASGASMDSDSPLSDLNAALLRDGVDIRFPAALDVERTLGILLLDNADAAAGVSQARVQIHMDSSSSARIIEYHASAGDSAHYANSVFSLVLADEATCDYVRVQDRAATHSQTGRLTVTLGRHSEFHHAAYDLGGDMIRNDLVIRIDAAESLATFHGLYLGDGSQHIDNHTRVDHAVGPAISQQEYRGILSGRSRGVWNGKALVHAGADGTDANQANHNLLLSETAEVDAKPELEIYTDEVKASHGTTIGQLDKNALFYLRTRGLDVDAARSLLTRAFAQKVVAMAPIHSIQETISEMVATKVARMIAGDS